jgi:mannitol/fructose-specific phosphotransferase system IIA component (Ntr-type)
MAAMIILEHPVDYNSLDGKPVKLFFMIITPEEKVNLHLRFLARVSRVLRDKQVRQDLFNCEDRDQAMDILREYESKHF